MNILQECEGTGTQTHQSDVPVRLWLIGKRERVLEVWTPWEIDKNQQNICFQSIRFLALSFCITPWLASNVVSILCCEPGPGVLVSWLMFIMQIFFGKRLIRNTAECHQVKMSSLSNCQLLRGNNCTSYLYHNSDESVIFTIIFDSQNLLG